MTDVAPLVRVLAQQSAIFERLLLSAHGLELLVAAGEARFLATAADETSELLSELTALELARAVASDMAAAHLGLLGSDHSLAEIVAAMPDGQGAVLAALGETLRRQAAEYEAVTGSGVTGLIEQRLDQLDAALDRVERGEIFVDGYSAAGSASAAVPAMRFDVGV